MKGKQFYYRLHKQMNNQFDCSSQHKLTQMALDLARHICLLMIINCQRHPLNSKRKLRDLSKREMYGKCK